MLCTLHLPIFLQGGLPSPHQEPSVIMPSRIHVSWGLRDFILVIHMLSIAHRPNLQNLKLKKGGSKTPGTLSWVCCWFVTQIFDFYMFQHQKPNSLCLDTPQHLTHLLSVCIVIWFCWTSCKLLFVQNYIGVICVVNNKFKLLTTSFSDNRIREIILKVNTSYKILF